MENKESRSGTFDESKINEETLKKYKNNYSEPSLLDKVTRYGKSIGISMVYKALQIWFVMQRPDVPASVKAVIAGALGYLISPLDFIPDLTPVLGYTDDLVAITFAFVKVQGYIDDSVNAKALKLLERVFGSEAVAGMKK